MTVQMSDIIGVYGTLELGSRTDLISSMVAGILQVYICFMSKYALHDVANQNDLFDIIPLGRQDISCC